MLQDGDLAGLDLRELPADAQHKLLNYTRTSVSTNFSSDFSPLGQPSARNSPRNRLSSSSSNRFTSSKRTPRRTQRKSSPETEEPQANKKGANSWAVDSNVPLSAAMDENGLYSLQKAKDSNMYASTAKDAIGGAPYRQNYIQVCNYQDIVSPAPSSGAPPAMSDFPARSQQLAHHEQFSCAFIRCTTSHGWCGDQPYNFSLPPSIWTRPIQGVLPIHGTTSPGIPWTVRHRVRPIC